MEALVRNNVQRNLGGIEPYFDSGKAVLLAISKERFADFANPADQRRSGCRTSSRRGGVR